LRANLYAITSAAFQPAIDSEKTAHAIWLIGLLNTEIPIATVWSTRIALCNSAQTFIKKCIIEPTFTIPEGVVASLWENLKLLAGDRGYESVRMAAAKTVAEFSEWVNGHSEWSHLQNQIKLDLSAIIEAETSTVIQAEYKR
jgi:hypothetical protein